MKSFKELFKEYFTENRLLKALLMQSLASLMQKKLRSILSTLGIFFGVGAVLAMLSIGEGAKQETLKQLEQLGTRNLLIRQAQLAEENYQKANWRHAYGLTMQDMRTLEQMPAVESIAALKSVEASLTLSADIPVELIAVSEGLLQVKGLSLLKGRFLSAADLAKKHQVCVLGEEVYRSLRSRGEVGRSLRLSDKEFLIVGILKGYEAVKGKISARNLNQTILIPLGTENGLVRQRSLKHDMLSELIVQIQAGHAMDLAASLIDRSLSLNHSGVSDYQVIIPKALMEQAVETQRTFNLILGSIAAISLLVGGIGIMNIMLANVSERTKEIGIRRSIGATFKHIVFQFLIESLILTSIGAFLGLLLGVLITLFISYFAAWHTIITFWAIASSLSMALFVGVCSGLYPAIQAAKVNPISALRHD
ncbi:MAG: ABC-type transporter, permease protein [Chlamydiales bacterium]|nr:ABC-type transporter, permease protein [Chlamydiales bacterium]